MTHAYRRFILRPAVPEFSIAIQRRWIDDNGDSAKSGGCLSLSSNLFNGLAERRHHIDGKRLSQSLIRTHASAGEVPEPQKLRQVWVCHTQVLTKRARVHQRKRR